MGNRLSKESASPFPGLLRRAKQHGSGMVQSGSFTPTDMLASLETSLHELHTDYVDLLLLHEAHLADATSEPLLDALQRQVDRGTVRAYGIASAFPKMAEAFHLLPSGYRVLQFDDNAQTLNRQQVESAGRGVITHSIFQPALALRNAIAVSADLATRVSRELGADVREPSVISSFLLHCALQGNPDGVVLFSSSDPRHILENARDTASAAYDEQQLASFVNFVKTASGLS